MAVDPETVALMSTYRVGYMPPKPESLSPGELYIEVVPPDQAAPRLWVGTPKELNFDGHLALLAQGSTADDLAPINLDVPHCYQEGASLTCTMGNWTGRPDVYAYQWKLDGTTDIGDGSQSYAPTPDDTGHTVTCVVSATNAIGTTEAPPSNGVVVE